LFPVLRGLASLYNFLNESDKARHLGERMFDLGERLGDVNMKVDGLLVTGYNPAFAANPQLGREHMEKAITLYNSQRRPARRLGIGPNSGVVSLNVSALFLWVGGYPARAYNRAADAIALAQELNHPYSLTYAQFHNGLLNMWLKNYENARDSAQAVELAETHGFQIWSAVGYCLRGAALVNIGGIDQGLAFIEQGLKAYRGLKTPPVFWPLLLHLCAAAYGTAS
jgi:tetratricopeptide (TPR) repeat protein